jgi:dihydrofolate reductase
VAMSLNGFIAGPDGKADWIVMDPDIDFGALFAEFDTLLIGRKTFEGVMKAGRASVPGMTIVVFSTTLRAADYPGVTIVSEGVEGVVSNLHAAKGKDIWLFGGGELFRSLLEKGLVDTVELGVMPVLLGEGIPLLPPGAKRASLKFVSQRVYNRSGIVKLTYAVR